MTLRQLVPMALEKKRVLGELAAYQVAWVAKLTTGETIDPHTINPYRERRSEPAEIRKLKEEDIKAEFRAGLRGFFKQRRGQ